MRRALLAACLVLGAGCGMGSATSMRVAAECRAGDLTVQVEPGVAPNPALHCQAALAGLGHYRAAYEERFGRQTMLGPIRLRAVTDLRATGIDESYAIAGHAYDDAIDLALGQWISLPHEMNHWRVGPGHAGWCEDFYPWARDVLGDDEAGYLGCH